MYWFRGLYEMSLRFIGLPDLWRLAQALVFSFIFIFVYGLWILPDYLATSRVPLAVLAIDALLTLFLTGALRLVKRSYVELILPQRTRRKPGQINALIVGAGDAADQLLRHLKRSAHAGITPIALLDDDPGKKGFRLHGIQVVGKLSDLAGTVARYAPDMIIVAIPSAPPATLRELYTEGQKAGVRQIRVLHSSLVPGDDHFQVDVKDIREVKVEELLGRATVRIDTTAIKKYLQGARILITGASGSIGSEIVRQVCQYEPEDVLCLDIDETGLFDLHRTVSDMPGFIPSPEVADIRNADRLEKVFQEFRPTIVFHAAAYKHVPLMEKFPEEAVGTNIIGTFNVGRLASKYGVERLIFVSTDKAVNPRNVMGASKRVAGKIVCGLQQKSATKFITVRFGNVLGSRGSVIPVFLDQLRRGGPLTVTHPEMVRYFMTIPEAVSLVLQSGALGEGGEVFVLDMGEPMKIMQLAEEVIRMHGMEPNVDIDIEITGMRPGEKLYEELLTAEEGTSSTLHQKIMKANLSEDESNCPPETIVQDFQSLLATAYEDMENLRAQIVQKLLHYVPTYNPNRTGND